MYEKVVKERGLVDFIGKTASELHPCINFRNIIVEDTGFDCVGRTAYDICRMCLVCIRFCFSEGECPLKADVA
ncbi:unnamed protein product [Cercopithifilaria johnstoni]|uniref:Uncharacterized protein n=1 Tax=Cercopithifilaria johnstoni TaxID=2874296 RepID=A0A8J2MD59_9BILA|nr:unnamed protein product [Cercopithifilaria johnstoni]